MGTAFLRRIVKIADLYVAFIAARLVVVTSVKSKLLPGDDAESARFFDADFYEKLAASPP